LQLQVAVVAPVVGSVALVVQLLLQQQTQAVTVKA
jgi:hypothetical protein